MEARGNDSDQIYKRFFFSQSAYSGHSNHFFAFCYPKLWATSFMSLFCNFVYLKMPSQEGKVNF